MLPLLLPPHGLSHLLAEAGVPTSLYVVLFPKQLQGQAAKKPGKLPLFSLAQRSHLIPTLQPLPWAGGRGGGTLLTGGSVGAGAAGAQVALGR